MGVDRSRTDLRGILVPDERVSFDNVTAKDHATALLQSSYTQAGASTGPAVPDQATSLVLRTSGAQSEDGDLEVLTRRSGGATAEGAGFVWRDVAAGDTTSEYMGIDPPGVVTGWDPLIYSTVSDGADVRPHVIRLLSDKLMASIGVTPVGLIRIRVYDSATSAWTNADLAPTNAGTGYIPGAVTLCQLSSGRVLCFCLATDQRQVDVYSSDDDGDNWTPAGYRILNSGVTTATVADMRAAYSPEAQEVLLLVTWTNAGTATCAQYASADLGTSFSEVVADWEGSTSEQIVTVDIVNADGGGFVVLYIDSQPTTDNLLRRRIGSAFTNITTAGATEPKAAITPGADVAGWRDDNGSLWLIVNDTAANHGFGSILRSLDNGDTWEAGSATGTHSTQSSSDFFTSYSAAMVAGRMALVSRWTASTGTQDPQSTAAVWYSGYSRQTAPSNTEAAASGANFRDTDYITYNSGAGGRANLWLPIETPPNNGWTTTGAGSEALTSSGALQIDTTTNARNYLLSANSPASDVFADFEAEVENGDGDTATDRIACKVRWGNNTAQYEAEIRMASTGFRVYDTNAAANVGALVSVSMTTALHVRVAVSSSGHVRTWYCRGGHYREWVEGPAGSLTDGGAGAYSRFSWGHWGTSTDQSRWTMVGYAASSGRWVGSQEDTLAESWSNPGSLKPQTYPNAPALIKDGVMIEAISGPSLLGETQRIKPVYQYPLSALFPDSSPSPSRGWRSTADNQNHQIVIDLERHGFSSDSFFESSSLGIFLVDTNIESCRLQRWSGSAWFDLASVDATNGFDTVGYDLYGRIVNADGAISGADPQDDRWSPHMMHAGDTVELKAGEGTVLRKIVANAEGGWRTGSKFARLRLDPEQIDGTEDAGGWLKIRRRNTGTVVHNFQAVPRYLRIIIPAHKAEGGLYKIGQLLIGPVFVFGLQHGNGWSDERSANVDISTRESGVRSSRVRGATRRQVQISWADQPQDTTRMWDNEPSPDFVTGVTGGDPVASVADTAYQVLGLVERTNGPDVPVVYLSRIERGTGDHHYTMDPQWLYGRITSNSASIDHVLGDDAKSPVVRGNAVVISEEV